MLMVIVMVMVMVKKSMDNDDDNDNRDKGFLWMGLRRMMVMMRRGSIDDMVVMRQEVPS